NAGNTLYKGISEILDRTMTERKDRIGSVDDLKTSTGAQIDQIRAATSALRQLREGIWLVEEPTDN
ncbi:MAG: hypothetical protein ABI678_15340, partial [Kofleriaceae bacterium]